MLIDGAGRVVNTAKAVPDPTVSIEGIRSGDADTPVEYFDLTGRRVLSPERGIYIERRGTVTRKVAF